MVRLRQKRAGGPSTSSGIVTQGGLLRDDERYDDRRYRERRYDERHRFSGDRPAYDADRCWQPSPRGNYVWVCR
jgi:hypothetical protein